MPKIKIIVESVCQATNDVTNFRTLTKKYAFLEKDKESCKEYN